MKDEKALIRSRCLDAGINKPEHRLALQDALEYPNDWGLIEQFGRDFSLHSLDEVPIIGNHGDADDDKISILETITFKGLLLLRGCANPI